MPDKFVKVEAGPMSHDLMKLISEMVKQAFEQGIYENLSEFINCAFESTMNDVLDDCMMDGTSVANTVVVNEPFPYDDLQNYLDALQNMHNYTEATHKSLTEHVTVKERGDYGKNSD